MGKPDGLSIRSGEEKSWMDAHFFNEGLLLDLENNDVSEEEHAEDVELEGIDVATWEKKTGLWGFPQDYRLEVLLQHHDSHVAGHWGRHRTQELVSRNFICDKWLDDVARFIAGYVPCKRVKHIGIAGKQSCYQCQKSNALSKK